MRIPYSTDIDTEHFGQIADLTCILSVERHYSTGGWMVDTVLVRKWAAGREQFVPVSVSEASLDGRIASALLDKAEADLRDTSSALFRRVEEAEGYGEAA